AQGAALLWVADTLGAPLADTIRLLESGAFDFYLASTRWWDLRAPWALEQYERLRPLARSIGFPEAPGESLREELARKALRDPAALHAELRLRYALAALFGSGVLMPLGFESGLAASSGGSGPDLVAAVTGFNRLKAAFPALALEQRQQRLALPGDVLCLLKLDLEGGVQSCVALNPRESGI